MRRILLGTAVLATLVVAGVLAMGKESVPVLAEKPTDSCVTIQDGLLEYSAGHFLGGTPLVMGYDVFGYNYQAHLFSGSYANVYLGRDGLPPYDGDKEAYEVAHPIVVTKWYWPYADDQVLMKWSDNWLSNKDCGTQDEYEIYGNLFLGDGTLDRHYPYDTYIGSGAWETNHQWGEYEGTDCYWDVTGDWLLDFAGEIGNRQFRNLLQDVDGNVTGEFWYLDGDWKYGGTLEGMVSGDTLDLHYDRYPIDYTGDFEATVTETGLIGGTFTDSHDNHLVWTAIGSAVEVCDTCYWDYFVKIVAKPTEDYTCKSIWGSFCIIQEVYNDPCGGYEGIQYKETPTGFGFYQP